MARLPDVLRANIYTPDRKGIWSSDPKVQLFRKPPPNPELEHALRGELEYERVSLARTTPNPSGHI